MVNSLKNLYILSSTLLLIIPGDGLQHFVDPWVVLVDKWDGWGTTLAWWAEQIGDHDDLIVDTVIRDLFHEDKLNLNIVRYVIGGTSPNEDVPFPCGIYRPGGASPSFKDGYDKEYNWTRDSRQRKILKKVMDVGVDTFEAFSNTPPQWMTISGCSKGNPRDFPLHNNLALDRIDDFTNYAADVIQHFHTEWNVTFSTYAPFNEPSGLYGIGGWFGDPGESQEGCNMNRSVMVAVMKSLHKTFADKGMDYVTISAPDETQVNTAIGSMNYFKQENVTGLMNKINVHGYWNVPGTRRDLLSIISAKEGLKLWMDEVSGPGFHEVPAEDMKSQGLNVGIRVVKDIREMLPSAWIWWQAMWGLISYPVDKPNAVPEDINYGSGYFSLMQFSKYIKQGYRVVFISDEDAVAAMNESGDILVIVAVNRFMYQLTKEYNLRLLSETMSIENVSVSRTSSSQHHSSVPSTLWEFSRSEAVLRIALPYESVTTIQIHFQSKVHKHSTQSENLIQNGDFESGPETWISSNMAPTETGISAEFPWRGGSSGFLIPPTVPLRQEENGIRISQILKLPQNLMPQRNSSYELFLSAWCATENANTVLLAEVKGGTGAQIGIEPFTGYRHYGVSFFARAGQDVRISYLSRGGKSYIDDVVVHYVVNGVDVDPDIDSGGPRALFGDCKLSALICLIICVNKFVYQAESVKLYL